MRSAVNSFGNMGDNGGCCVKDRQLRGIEHSFIIWTVEALVFTYMLQSLTYIRPHTASYVLIK